MTDRIYVVTDTTSNEITLVEASSQSHALRRITAPRFTVRAANTADMMRVLQNGGKVLTHADQPETAEKGDE